MTYHWDFGVLWQYRDLFVLGTGVTLAFTVGTMLLGLLVGLLIGMARLSHHWLISTPLIAISETFRCTPLLVQLIWIYYALPVVLHISLSAIAAAVITLSMYGGVFYAEIFRGGIVSIERGQWDAARALGLSWWPMMRLVILPQAIQRMIPPFMNQSIIQLKNTSLVSVISVPDVLYQGELVTGNTYRPLEVYTMVAIIYFVLLFPSTILMQAYERRMAAKGAT